MYLFVYVYVSSCSEHLLLKFDLKSVALERELDLGPGPVDQWDWIWNIMNSCTE